MPFSYRYLIKESDLSYSQTGKITCPNSKLIFVYSAFYGRQFKQTFSQVALSKACPDVCYNRSSYQIQKSLCHGKSSCNFSADLNTYVGGLCSDCFTKLYSEYLCVGNKTFSSLNKCPILSTAPKEICPASSDFNIENQTWKNNEPSGALIQCPSGKEINLTCVFLGFDNLNAKNIPGSIASVTAIYSHDLVYFNMTSLCNRKNNCSIRTNATFGFSDYFFGSQDGFRKYRTSVIFQVQWRCI